MEGWPKGGESGRPTFGLGRWRYWAGLLVFFALVMGSTTTGPDGAQRGAAAAMATGALVLLLTAVGLRELRRRVKAARSSAG